MCSTSYHLPRKHVPLLWCMPCYRRWPRRGHSQTKSTDENFLLLLNLRYSPTSAVLVDTMRMTLELLIWPKQTPAQIIIIFNSDWWVKMKEKKWSSKSPTAICIQFCSCNLLHRFLLLNHSTRTTHCSHFWLGESWPVLALCFTRLWICMHFRDSQVGHRKVARKLEMFDFGSWRCPEANLCLGAPCVGFCPSLTLFAA